MKFVPLLLSISLLLGTYFTTRVEAQEKSKSEQKKSSTSNTISKKQLVTWINQLSEGTFRERRTASNNLLKAGKQALPFLEKGARRNDAELSTRCFDIVVHMYRGQDESRSSAAKKALGKLEKSSNKSLAQRTKNTIQKKLQEDAIARIKKLGGKIRFDQSGNVEYIFLRGSKVTDSDLVHMKCLTSLRELDLIQTKITGIGLENLKQLTGLNELSLSSTQITDATLVNLKGMTNLESLWLGNTWVTDTGLMHLKKMTNLKLLSLSDLQVGNTSLVHLKEMTKLETLWLNNTKVTDAGLIHLAGLTSLQRLNLPETKVTGTGLVHLKGLPKLDSLDLTDTKVTDSGLVLKQAMIYWFLRLLWRRSGSAVGVSRQVLWNCFLFKVSLSGVCR